MCNLLLKYGADVNNVNSNGKSTLDIKNATGDQKIIILIKEYQNTRKVNKGIEEARKHIKALEIKQIIGIKNENIAKMRKKNARVHHLKQLILENQQEKDNIETQVALLVEQKNKTIKQLNELKNNYSPIKLLLEKQSTECEAAVNNVLD